MFDPRYEVQIGSDRIPKYNIENATKVDVNFGQPPQGGFWLIERIAVHVTLGGAVTGNEHIIVYGGDDNAIDLRDFFPVGPGSPYLIGATIRVVADENEPIRIWPNEQVIIRAAGLTAAATNAVTASIQVAITAEIGGPQVLAQAAGDAAGAGEWRQGNAPHPGGWNRGAGI